MHICYTKLKLARASVSPFTLIRDQPFGTNASLMCCCTSESNCTNVLEKDISTHFVFFILWRTHIQASYKYKNGDLRTKERFASSSATVLWEWKFEKLSYVKQFGYKSSLPYILNAKRSWLFSHKSLRKKCVSLVDKVLRQ